MKSEDYIKIQEENHQLPNQNLNLGRRYTCQQNYDSKLTTRFKKQDHSSAMAFYES